MSEREICALIAFVVLAEALVVYIAYTRGRIAGRREEREEQMSNAREIAAIFQVPPHMVGKRPCPAHDAPSPCREGCAPGVCSKLDDELSWR